jgi:hypothetical protein
MINGYKAAYEAEEALLGGFSEAIRGHDKDSINNFIQPNNPLSQRLQSQLLVEAITAQEEAAVGGSTEG